MRILNREDLVNILYGAAILGTGGKIIQINDLVYRAEVQAVKAQIAQTEAELKFAKRNFERQKKLLGQN